MDMNQMMHQARKMQAQLTEAQDAVAAAEVEGSAGGGMVKVTANGNGEVKSIVIAPDVVDPDDVEMLQDLILAAIADASAQAKAIQDDKLGGIAGGLGIPGL
ncbi:MAG: YbaB/EbfC family nucleoid-associated protein [Coriobacteriales bacterium]|jgi:DNA-binding YbaB/EbfC family protein|nr:YbaB/EbfC family nucleoid-associated protein [Coriobacteriales bacterium]